MTDKTQARIKHKMGMPTNVPFKPFQVCVRWTFNNQDKAPIANDIWVMLMENMENATKAIKQERITLSKIGIIRLVPDELVSEKSFSIFKR
ncbi:MAG: hypothetical protein F3745_03675 [Nitrospinae bacterium]|nr:hypothetical protein [Nitrospinota bacterium]